MIPRTYIRPTYIGRLCLPLQLTASPQHSAVSRRTYSERSKDRRDDAKQNKPLYYYEEDGNTMNPHTYLYRVLAVPFLKFCGVMIGTYYGMNGIWWYLENSSNDKEVKEEENV